jgi:Cof subfamily protein (haloacid dehalogenase superfamily)
VTRRIYVSDLDGTLLRHDATLSPRSRAGLHGLLRAGVPITVATARSAEAVRFVLGDVPLALPIIECNGAFVTDLASGERLHVHAVEFDSAGASLDILERFGVTPFVLTHGASGERLRFCEPRNAAMKWYRDEKLAKRDPRLDEVGRVSLSREENVVALTILDRREVVEAIASELRALVPSAHVVQFANHYCEGFWELSVQSAEATKANALRKLADGLGVDSCDVVVFGDNDNDVGMFEFAGRAIAVSNSSALALSKASLVIGSNEEDSVVKYIEHDVGDLAHESKRWGVKKA